MTKQDLQSEMARAMGEIAALVGDVFTYKGICYTGVINDTEISGEFLPGGQLELLATMIVVPAGVLPNVPLIGETVKVGAKSMRILKVKTDFAAVELVCETAAR